MVADGTCVWIKYAVVRKDPKEDAYLEALLARVDKSSVVSGIGERPAIVHMRDWSLARVHDRIGLYRSRGQSRVFGNCVRRDYDRAESFRQRFLPLEDLRDAWGPARVLHAATELLRIATTGPIPPFVSPLNEEQLSELEPVAQDLVSAFRLTTP